jgi:hypothetical protein
MTVLVVQAAPVADVTPPTVTSFTVDSAGTKLTVQFDEAITGNAGFTIDPSGGAATLSSPTNFSTSIDYVISRAIQFDETITADYTAGDVTDTATNPLATITGASVTNNSSAGGGDPDLPTSEPDTSLPAGWDGTADYTPSNSSELITALSDSASDSGMVIIELTAGTTYTGVFVVDNSGKPDNDWTIIRSSNYSSLQEGSRIDLTDDPNLAELLGSSTIAIRLNDNAKYVRFIGIKFRKDANDGNNSVVAIGLDAVSSSSSLAEFPNDIILDRCRVTTTNSNRTSNGVFINGTDIAVINSRIDRIIGTSGEAHAFQVYRGGPCLFENNFISGSHINAFLGDNDEEIASQQCRDITIRKNHLWKDTEWDVGGSEEDVRVKNHFEIKHGRRVLFEQNVCENNWSDAQNGSSWVFTPRGGDMLDVTVRWNVVKNSERAMGISAPGGGTGINGQIADLLLENNLFFGGTDRLIEQSGSSSSDPAHQVHRVTLRHNTFHGCEDSCYFFTASFGGSQVWVFRDNIVDDGLYGMGGSGTGYAVDGITDYVANYDVDNNVHIDVMGPNYTTDANFKNVLYAANDAAVGFTNSSPTQEDHFELLNSSAYYQAGTDGKDIGADIATLLTKVAGVE